MLGVKPSQPFCINFKYLAVFGSGSRSSNLHIIVIISYMDSDTPSTVTPLGVLTGVKLGHSEVTLNGFFESVNVFVITPFCIHPVNIYISCNSIPTFHYTIYMFY